MADPIDDCLAAIARGEMIVVTDDEFRENEGDLLMAADHVSPEAINFMARYGRGLICAPLTQARADRLGLPPMAQAADRFRTAFTVSVDAKQGVTTGISAGDRALTVSRLAAADADHDDFVRPGHVFPIIAREGGVLVRSGHTEAAVDFARLAGCQPVGVICEIMNDDGSMARLPDIRDFVDDHGLKWATIADLVRYRQQRETLIDKSGQVRMPSHFAPDGFTLHCYVSRTDGKEHVALVYGEVADRQDLLVRVHSECLTGDVFHSARCDCGEQLERALQLIAEAGAGILIYLRQEGRGIGLINKINAYQLQDEGLDTVEANVRLGFPADLRDYSVAARILEDLGVASIRLLTNNPRKITGLEEFGVDVRERVPLIVTPRTDNARYLQTKKERLGHLL